MKVEEKYVRKTWGHEIWFDNNELYCGKQLYVECGKWSSEGKYHYHKNKTETFFIIRGALNLEYIEDGVKWGLYLCPGEAIRLNPNTPHRFTTKIPEGCTFIEVSTTHEDSDSYYDCPENKDI